MLYVNIVIFIIMQVGATLLFKWGGTPGRYWWGFGLGNVVGASSIIFLINIYKMLNPNLAAAICSGGSFLAIQVAMFALFRESRPLPILVGTVLISSGIAVMSLWK